MASRGLVFRPGRRTVRAPRLAPHSSALTRWLTGGHSRSSDDWRIFRRSRRSAFSTALAIRRRLRHSRLHSPGSSVSPSLSKNAGESLPGQVTSAGNGNVGRLRDRGFIHGVALSAERACAVEVARPLTPLLFRTVSRSSAIARTAFGGNSSTYCAGVPATMDDGFSWLFERASSTIAQ